MCTTTYLPYISISFDFLWYCSYMIKHTKHMKVNVNCELPVNRNANCSRNDGCYSFSCKNIQCHNVCVVWKKKTQHSVHNVYYTFVEKHKVCYFQWLGHWINNSIWKVDIWRMNLTTTHMIHERKKNSSNGNEIFNAIHTEACVNVICREREKKHNNQKILNYCAGNLICKIWLKSKI